MENQPRRCLVIGDINIDTVMHISEFPSEGGDVLIDSAEQRLGGSGCNTAVVLSQLGVETLMVGHLGTDPFARLAMQRLKEVRVHLQHVQRDSAYTTGFVMILVTGGGERTMLGYRGANVVPVPVDQIAESLERVHRVHISGYAFVDDRQWASVQETMRLATRMNLKISLDPGIYATKQVPDRVLSSAYWIDDLLISDREIEVLFPEKTLDSAVEGLLTLGSRAVVVKLGAQGSLFASGETRVHEPAIQSDDRPVIDTTGAGDVFNAGYLYGRMRHLDPDACLRLGNAAGYLKVTSPHGAAELSDDRQLLEQVEALLDNR